MRELLKAGLGRFGYRIGRTPPLASEHGYTLEVDFDYVLARYLSRRDNRQPFFFIQVGAFDGVVHDPLHNHVREGRWHGVLVEPQPRYFARLVENYKDLDGLTFVNAAIDRENGSKTLYNVQDERGESIDSLGGLSSFSRERLEDWQRLDGHLAPGGSHIGSVQVRCVTFEDVLADAAYVDLVHLDVEGYDLELLKLFDFSRFAPAIVRFEHVHLSRRDWDEAITLLARNGYRMVREEYDTTAYREPLGR